MEMDSSCSENAEYNDCKSSSLLNARSKDKSMKAKGDMAKNSGERDGRKGLVMELFENLDQGQDSMEVNG